MIPFHPLTLADRDLVQQRVLHSDYRYCDYNFLNLIGWRFMYDTEVADYKGWLLFRFKADGHLAYQIPVGNGDRRDIIKDMLDDAQQQGHPFLMLGVFEHALAQLEMAMPGYFFAKADRNYSEYIYSRDKLSTLSGKKLQPKRNFINRFVAQHPDYQFVPLTPDLFDRCLELDHKWAAEKVEEETHDKFTYEAERQALVTMFDNWEATGARGGALIVDNEIIAFTLGAGINYDTFDVCIEKADTQYEGAFTIINRDFVRSLPEQYVYINREEDLGLPGLRRSKLSYHPEQLLHKYTVMTKHPLGE